MDAARAPATLGVRLRAPARLGALAAAGMLLLYGMVVAGASGSFGHLLDQVATDWYLLAPIVAGFGLQVGLLAELRRRHRLRASAAATGAVGAASSTAGMVACCAHHIADLAPFVGATAAATFLYRYRIPFMLVGLGINGVAITVILRRLRRIPAPRTEVFEACVPEPAS